MCLIAEQISIWQLSVQRLGCETWRSENGLGKEREDDQYLVFD
jgi:hypothetical protein